MTILALGRCNEATVLVADTMVGTQGGTAGPTVTSEQDKLVRIFGRTYVTVAGDPTVLDALTFLVPALDPDDLALGDPNVIDAVLTGVERLRTIHGVTHNPVSAMLLVCSPTEAFYWVSTFDPGATTFSRPTGRVDVAQDTGIVVWGRQTQAITTYQLDPADPFAPLIATMVFVDGVFRGKGGSLGYVASPGARYSGVMNPRDEGKPIRRLQPFATIPERMACYFGATSWLGNPAFSGFPKI